MEAMTVVPIPRPGPPIPPHRPLPLRVKLQYLYLLRVPILVWVAVFVLPIVSLTRVRQLLGNLFVLTPWNIFWTMIAAEMLAMSILVMWRVVLLNGRERFGIRQGMIRDVITWQGMVLAEVVVIPIMLAAIFSNGQVTDAYTGLVRLSAALAGLLLAHVGGFLGLLVSVWLSPRYRRPKGRFPVPFRWMRYLIVRAYRNNVVSKKKRAWLGGLAARLPMAFRAGYFDPRTHLLYPGQWLSFVMLFSSFGLYKLIGALKQARLGEPFGIPAICYLILLLILLHWVLAITAFFVDRFRIPLLVPILGLIIVGNLASGTDHYYEIRAVLTPKPVNPALVLTAANRLGRDKDHPRGRVTVVATAGGGIQAAAWTAQVLTGLQTELKERSPDKQFDFANSIAAISSVSGGAVGTMFFVNQYKEPSQRQGFAIPDRELPAIVSEAEASSLDDVAWAMVYPDLARVVFPFGRGLTDRGWALEEAWRIRGNLNSTLSEWRQGVEEGWRPAVIFNSTLAESGEPLVLTTTDMRQKEVNGLGRRNLPELLPGYDVPVVTAVRLAASFPFVTPASRAFWNPQAPGVTNQTRATVENDSKYHLVDGGYYDNYGVNSLLEWLSEAMESQSAKDAPDILIIQIRSFPSEAGGPDGKERGWFYQAWAPVGALMRVRTTGQLVRDREELDRFACQWSAKGAHIRLATFEFQGSEAPLSWKMNQSQIQAIKDQWRDRVSGNENGDWRAVNCFFLPNSSGCPKPGATEKKGAW